MHETTPASHLAVAVDESRDHIEGPADAPATLVIYDQYKDEAALESHRNSPHFREYGTEGIFKMMRGRHLERLNAIE